MIKNSILILTFLVCLGLTMEPPLWPEHFSQSFDVDTGYSYMTGHGWYDFTNGSFSRMDFDHADGRVCQIYDEYIHSKCTHLVANMKLYYILPEEELCCYNNLSGTTQRDWLRNGSYIYTGEVQLNGESFHRWQHYNWTYIEYLADTSQKMIPRRNGLPKILFDYWVDSYSEAPINPSIFNVPSYCQNQCSWNKQNTQQTHMKKQLRHNKSLNKKSISVQQSNS